VVKSDTTGVASTETEQKVTYVELALESDTSHVLHVIASSLSREESKSRRSWRVYYVSRFRFKSIKTANAIDILA
jgi:hypothetical protein